MCERATMEVQDLVEKPGKKTSPVWDYFGFEPNDDGKPKNEDRPICKQCMRTVATKGSNTSNLLSHMRTTHPIVHAELQAAAKEKRTSSGAAMPAKQQTLADSIAKSTAYARNSKKWQKLTDAVTYCMAKEMMPLYTVEKTAFRRMLKEFDSQYELPSRKYFSGTAIPALYERTRVCVAAEVQEIEFFSATTDLWSSSTMEPYLSYTIHYVGGDWQMHSRCLQTLFCPEDHTGENLAEALRSSLERWNLRQDQQTCLTTDSGTNVINATERLSWTRLPCFGHILHNAVTNATKDDRRITRALGVSRKLVGTFSHSWKKKRELTKVQADLKLPNHSLVTDCPTRWGSRIKMVERILEQEAAIRQVLSGDRKTSHLIPTWQDVDVLESVNRALSPLKDFTDILSGERYVTVSAVKPVLKLLNSSVLAAASDDTQLTKDIKSRVMAYMEEKYSDQDVNELLDVATFLDPRFKMEYTDEEDQERIKDRVIEEATEVERRGQGSQENTTPADSEPPPAKRNKLGALLKKSRNEEVRSGLLAPTPLERVQREVEKYFHSPTPDSESDPLDWWKLNCTLFPCLSKVAKKYLCICATSSPSERLFSNSGNVVTSKRTSLKPEKVNMLVFLSKNLQ